MDTIQTTVFQTSRVSFGWWEDGPFDFWSWDQRSRSNLALSIKPCWHNTNYRSLSNFTLRCWCWEEGPYWFWVTGLKVKVKFGTLVYKILWTKYRLQFLPNHFQTPYVSCGWWEEGSYWFWVMGSKVKRKWKRSDSVLWQKPLYRQRNPNSNVTTQKRHQKLRLHNDCGPT